ncbi:heavy-metal-associated domain-containing protein [uncultured Streptomyces sp.]|uniref:heavy-metal-associated domain-containing protein n=1 Tax=uncultured Streptomyces sp. TaxID=174707 RepID=UPI002608317E|nr:heavy-metal-associated domain-containing protein [uncultured Streptomyces sp.]
MTAETETPRAAGSCCSTDDAVAAEARTGAVTTVYEVKGMSCGHCEGAVSEEISGIEGVTSVQATASTGRVTVVSEAEPADEAVRAAVDEAGFELVGRA